MSALPATALAIPLYDEEALVHGVVADILAVADRSGLPLRLVLVDNGSRDGTGRRVDALAAADPRVRAIHLSANRGYGGGILAGLAAAWSASIDGRPVPVLGWMWGDGQVDPAVLPALAAAVADGAELAHVRRVRRRDGWRRAVVTRVYAATVRLLGVDCPDVNGCPKLFRRELLARLDLRAGDWFLDFEAVAGATALGARIETRPAVMQPRVAGRSKVAMATVVEFSANLARWKLRGWPHGSDPLPPSCYARPAGGHHAD
ncbi:MAG: glycosyltransferase [Deltaproteobacteria bacterium]|nr:MAG: glycosyltransferase [Deltaproteobacteria bacterium]